MSLPPTDAEDNHPPSSFEDPEEGDSTEQFHDNLESVEEHELSEEERDSSADGTLDNPSPPPEDQHSVAESSDLQREASNEEIEKNRWDDDNGSMTSCTESIDQMETSPWDDFEIYDPFMTWEDSETQTDWDWADKSLYFHCKGALPKETEDLHEEEERNIDIPAVPQETEGFPDEIDTPFIGLPRIIAYKPEPRGPQNTEVELSAFHLVECEYCKKLSTPVTIRDVLVVEEHDHFCCDEAKQMQEFLQMEKKKLERKDVVRRVDENAQVAAKAKSEKERLKQMLEHLDEALTGMSVTSLPKEIKNDAQASQMSLKSLDLDVQPKIKEVIEKFYNNGKYFLILCPDGTGTLLFNSTPDGGFCFSESGCLTRRWNWLYFDPHVRNLPFKPLTFSLGPYISVRIHTQENMYVTFRHPENTARFNVGSKLMHYCPESHLQPNLDVVERYVQLKTTDIHALLDQMQTCISHPSALLHKIKPHPRFIARKQRLSEQLKMVRSFENESVLLN